MFTDFSKRAILLFLNLPENPIKKAVRDIFYGEVVTERIIEYVLVFMHLKYPPSTSVKILDIGCYYSNFPIQLASLGYKTTGIDLMDYQLTHPNFTFIREDIRETTLKKNSFDIVTCVSTIEHIGIGVWGDKKDQRGDIDTMKSITKLLKPNGQFLLTIPFGKKSVTPSQRNYDWEQLKDLLHDYKIKKDLYYVEKDGKWLPSTRVEALKVLTVDRTRAMAFIDAIKK